MTGFHFPVLTRIPRWSLVFCPGRLWLSVRLCHAAGCILSWLARKSPKMEVSSWENIYNWGIFEIAMFDYQRVLMVMTTAGISPKTGARPKPKCVIPVIPFMNLFQ